MDLSSLESVRKCAEEILGGETSIDVLVNNAGVLGPKAASTKDGLEIHMGTNYVGHFLLTNLLLGKMRSSSSSSSSSARIVNVTSLMHKFATLDPEDLNSERKELSAIMRYSRSKLALVLFTRELHRRLEGSGVACYAVCPGVVSTNIHG